MSELELILALRFTPDVLVDNVSYKNPIDNKPSKKSKDKS